MNAWAAVRRNFVEPVMRAQGSPKSIARGAALGTWVTLTPTVGIQMFLTTVAALPLRANLPIAIALVWLSNPLTIIPMYYGYYWIGALLLAEPRLGYRELGHIFAELFRSLEHGGFLDSLRSLGSDVLWPLLLGSLVIATLATIPTYHLSLRWALRREARRIREAAAAAAVEASPPAGQGAPGGPEPAPGAGEATGQDQLPGPREAARR